MTQCEVCGNEHDQDIEVRGNEEWIYCPRFDVWLNLSEHNAQFEEQEQQAILENEMQYEKDMASHD